jgi:hypothetical protein
MQREASDCLIVYFAGISIFRMFTKDQAACSGCGWSKLGQIFNYAFKIQPKAFSIQKIGISTEPLSNSHVMCVVGQQEGCVLSLEPETSNNS